MLGLACRWLLDRLRRVLPSRRPPKLAEVDRIREAPPAAHDLIRLDSDFFIGSRHIATDGNGFQKNDTGVRFVIDGVVMRLSDHQCIT